MAITFSGGIHVDGCKGTNKKPIEDMPAPEFIALPLQQHIGAPVKAIVAKGDTVGMGQVIARNDAALSCPVHASVSGTVERIETRNSYMGAGKTEFVVIKNDGEYRLCEDIKPYEKKITEITCDEVVNLVREAGISGMGGATFPAYAKIQSAAGKAKEIIVNCAECEPFITANHRLLLERPMDVINGVKILLIALGLKKATFAIEDNKKNAAKVLEELVSDDEMFSVKLLKTKYPQGDERQIVYALNGVEIRRCRLCYLQRRDLRGGLSRRGRGHAADCPHRDDRRRLYRRAEEPSYSARNLLPRCHRILRRYQGRAFQDHQRRSHDGRGAVGS